MVRVTKETRPWGDGGKQMTRKVYAPIFPASMMPAS